MTSLANFSPIIHILNCLFYASVFYFAKDIMCCYTSGVYSAVKTCSLYIVPFIKLLLKGINHFTQHIDWSGFIFKQKEFGGCRQKIHCGRPETNLVSLQLASKNDALYRNLKWLSTGKCIIFTLSLMSAIKEVMSLLSQSDVEVAFINLWSLRDRKTETS